MNKLKSIINYLGWIIVNLGNVFGNLLLEGGARLVQGLIALYKHATDPKNQGGNLIFIALMLFFVFSPAIRLIDAEAGRWDSGVLQNFILGMINASLQFFTAWVLFQSAFPTLNKFLDLEGFKEQFEQLKPEWKISVICAAFALVILVVHGCFSQIFNLSA